MTQTFNFTVNGKSVSLALANEETPLLNVLRNELGLMGTRFGCGLEQCGCCTVLIDGTPEKPHPLQQAFIDEQAGQCGYCLAGIIVSAKALLDMNPSPTRAEIAAALDDNICRCGSHNRIIRAVQKAAKQMQAGAAS
jgi:nicotinate dehydrogenase subunit A